MTTKNEPVLPLGDKPFWDQRRSAEEGTEIKSVSESCVLLQSLKQSRERWLLKTFPKFSSRSRGNKDPAPPPHTIQTRGTCDVAIGPHIFPDTVFYEVHYLPPQGQPSALSTQPQTANPYWQSGSSYSTGVTAGSSSQVSLNNSTSTAKPDNNPTSSSLDSLPTSIALTPNLIQQVNSAASSNPILANLLQLAAAGNATQDQLKTLGLLIQSFATLASVSSATSQMSFTQPALSSYGSYPVMPFHPPVKEFDLVFEFREAPHERWFVPRVPVYVERKPSPDAPSELDVSMLTCVPFKVDKESQNSEPRSDESPSQYQVSFILKNAPYAVWETIWRWVGGDIKNKANKVEIESQVSPPRLYLGYQLPPGSLLTQFQAASAPPYTMRTLKQGPSSQTRARQKRKKQADAAPAENSNDATGDTVLVKRARSTQSKVAMPVPIQCIACKNADVPLILGGKYCRPCAEVEKQKPNAPTPMQS